MNRCRPFVAASTVLLAVLAARLPADEGSNAGVQARGETRISLTKLADEVASRIIASTPLAQSGLDRRIKAEFVEIVTTYGPSRPSPEYVRDLLAGLDAYLKKSFPEGAQAGDPVRRDEAYLNLIRKSATCSGSFARPSSAVRWPTRRSCSATSSRNGCAIISAHSRTRPF